MSAQTMRRAFIIFISTVIAILITALLFMRYIIQYPERPLGDSSDTVEVVIPQGTNFQRVVKILEGKHIIKSGVAFRIYANYKGLASKVRAGTYPLKKNITPQELLTVLVHGVPSPTVSVLIPEGKNMLEVADLLAQARIAKKSVLIKTMYDRRFLHRLGISGESMEGYLFPDTYRLRTNSNPKDVLENLFRRHCKVYYALQSRHASGLKWLRKHLRWGHHEIVTMASIVEKETGQAAERPLIAGVFLNRLTFSHFSPKLLQTDPTIIYGCTVPQEKSPSCQKFEGRIRRIHLNDSENPYNTYVHEGLPPGPISNPGRAAIEAVLAPKKSRYLYFVSKNDGTHYFSKSKAEHEAAVDKYQRH